MPYHRDMDRKRNRLISTFSAQITSTISVALVLLVLGVAALSGIAARTVTREIKENMGFNIILADGASEQSVNGLKQQLGAAVYVSSYSYYSADDALRQWQEDTGEDLGGVLDVNPFYGEFDVKVKELYANVDSINVITTALKANKAVGEITVHTEMVESINRNIRSLAVVLAVIASTLLLISFVLINNTVRLTIYSRRFTIHTMKLVGATPGFIRKPFIVNNLVHGVVAAVVASALLSGLLYYSHSLDASVAYAVTWVDAVWVYGGLLVTGVVICLVSTLISTNRYLKLSYDDMFK